MEKINIPVGVSDFFEIRQNNYYYVDKSYFIREILRTPATKVTLITHPRRFGKTLGMSMLDSFFDIQKTRRYGLRLRESNQTNQYTNVRKRI